MTSAATRTSTNSNTMLLLCFTICFHILITSCEIQYKLVEESPPGTIVGKLIQDLRLESSFIASLKITNWNEPNGERNFAINTTTGDLYVKSRPNREVICPYKPLLCKVVLSIAFGNRHEPSFDSVVIEVEDINDNAPTFPHNYLSRVLPENTKVHHTENLLSAADSDAEENGTISYTLDNPELAPFVLKPGDTPDDPPRLILTAKLDWKTRNKYTMRVIAKDNGRSKSLSGTLTVNIVVKDINDNAPIFTQSAYDATIKENINKGETILDLEADDQDHGINGKVSYSIAEASTSSDQEASRFFGIRPFNKKGQLYVRENLDIDRRSSREFQFTVTAMDNGNPRQSSSAKVTIRVDDVNDYTPQIGISYANDDKLDKNKGYVRENIDRSYIGHVTVTDYDSGSGGDVLCKTSDKRFQLEEMNQHSGGSLMLHKHQFKLMSIERFDREQTPLIRFIIQCTDNPGKPNSEQLIGSADVEVAIQDENDETPQFEKQLYTFYVLENVPRERGQSHRVGEVKAIDKDFDANIIYQLSSNPYDAFKINPSTGMLSIIRSFDREQTPGGVNLTVKATDNYFSNSTIIHIVITDENDSKPQFSPTDYHFSVEENSRNATVGQVTATDADEDKNITYSISDSSKNLFSIHSVTGRIQVNRALDRERKEVYTFDVYAKDNVRFGTGGSIQLTGTASVIVNVLDVNDNSPVINYPLDNSAIDAEVGYPIGQNLLTMSATDSDEGVNGTITFSLFSGDKSLFGVDPTSGYVYLNGKLTDKSPAYNVDSNDRTGGTAGKSLENTYYLVLKASDGGTPSRSTTVQIRIVVKPKLSNDLGFGGRNGDLLSSTVSNRIVIIILATIFVVLLVTTFLLACLIKRRRDQERNKFRAGGKIQFGKSTKSEELTMNVSRLDDQTIDIRGDQKSATFRTGRGEYQGFYSPLRTQLMIGQDGSVLDPETHAGCMDSKGGGPGVVFWCQGGSQLDAKAQTLPPGMINKTNRHGYMPNVDSYQTLMDTSFGTNASLSDAPAQTKDTSHLYYEIANTGKPTSLSTQQHYQPYNPDVKSSTMYQQSRHKQINDSDKSQTIDSGNEMLSSSRAGTPGSDLDDRRSGTPGGSSNPWYTSKDGQTIQTSRHSTRRKKPTDFSPYAEASFV